MCSYLNLSISAKKLLIQPFFTKENHPIGWLQPEWVIVTRLCSGPYARKRDDSPSADAESCSV